MNYKHWILFGALLCTTGCMVGPKYHRPRVAVPEDWRTHLENTSECVLGMEWWKEFNDPILDELIVVALQNNQNLKLATARVDEFIGLYRVARSHQFPFIFGDELAGRNLISERAVPSIAAGPNPQSFFEAIFSGSWEIDLWGKLKSATDAAFADLMATRQARQAVVQELVTSVAIGYIDLLRLVKQLEISIKTADTRKVTLDLFHQRFDAGVISRIELSQIESEYRDAAAAIPGYERDIVQQENLICVLLGQNPGPIERGNTLFNLQYPEIPSRLPSSLFFNRPDIQEAEEQLIAANARITVARAAYFPTISLTGQYGNASMELSSLFTGPGREWAYFIPANVPIFDAGKVSGTVQAATGVRNEAIHAYKQVILEAFSDVENALISIQKTKERLDQQALQVEALKTYASLARYRYDEGYTSYLEVLDAERNLFNVELSFSDTQTKLYIAYINLFRSLGGDWIKIASDLSD